MWLTYWSAIRKLANILPSWEDPDSLADLKLIESVYNKPDGCWYYKIGHLTNEELREILETAKVLRALGK